MTVADSGNPGDILWNVRQVVPCRRLEPGEDLELAEIQARRLLKLLGISQPPVSLAVITSWLGIHVTTDHGTGVVVPKEPKWAADGWHITVARVDGRSTRSVVAHQLKHILDDQYGAMLYPPTDTLTTVDRRELAADRFSQSLLMPREWLLMEAWRHSSRTTQALAKRFGAPEAMVRRRLVGLGLVASDEVGVPPPTVG
jgi:hypothetical protein